MNFFFLLLIAYQGYAYTWNYNEHGNSILDATYWESQSPSLILPMASGYEVGVPDGDDYEVGWMRSKSSATTLNFQETGTGARISRMIRQSEGFCFISGVRAIFQDRERCAVIPDSGFWSLEATSHQNDYECRATCVLGVEATISGLFHRNGAGDTPSTITLGSATNRVCFLTGLRWLSTHSQECETTIVRGNWVLRGRSHRERFGDFRCEARCATFRERVTMSNEVVYSGVGNWRRSLGSQSSTFCFVSNVRNINLGGEICRVTDSRGFELVAQSNQGTYRCGATCASVPNSYNSITMGWQFITAGTRDISMTITEGVTRSNGESVTNSWSSSFSLQLASPGFSSFGGVAVTSTISSSTATQLSSSFSRNAGRTLSANCPAQPGKYVALFQYNLYGNGAGGTDMVQSMLTRCHYSESANVPAPQCPFQACGSLVSNPNCQRAGCDRWS